jgi:pullulanase/glycogen debranching enzyme
VALRLVVVSARASEASMNLDQPWQDDSCSNSPYSTSDLTDLSSDPFAGASFSRAGCPTPTYVLPERAELARSFKPGATLDPKTESVTIEVQVDPQQVQQLSVLLFDENLYSPGESLPPVAAEIPMEKVDQNTFAVTLHGPSVKEGLLYALRPTQGSPINSAWLVDPYAKAVVMPEWNNPVPGWDRSYAPSSNDFRPQIGVVVAEADNSARPPKPQIDDAHRVMYEVDIRATKDIPNEWLPKEWQGKQGTVEFIGSPFFIGHLKSMNINSVELMPVTAGMDEWKVHSSGRSNVWGYNPVHPIALHGPYFGAKDPIVQIKEFNTMVDSLHQAGIEVVVDIVMGHSAERGKDVAPGNKWYVSENPGYVKGPTMHMRGLADKQYYHHDANGEYIDATGCEHTIDVNTPLGRGITLAVRDRFINDLNVDGLRIDQMPTFGRQSVNHNRLIPFSPNHPFLKEFTNTNGIVIAEPVDGQTFAGQLAGSFARSGSHLEHVFDQREVNRAFFAGEHRAWDGNIVGKLATTVSGYSSYFPGQGNRAVRFAAVHDGSTTFDAADTMVHKLGERGIMQTGPHNHLDIQISIARAIHSSVIFAPGTYMIARGEEYLRTQQGMSDPYDREEFVGLGWGAQGTALANERSEFKHFIDQASELRKELEVFHTVEHYNGAGRIQWMDRNGYNIESGSTQNSQKRGEAWDSQDRFLGALYPGFKFGNDVNPVFVVRSGTPTTFTLPRATENFEWERRMDSTLPQDQFAPVACSGGSHYHLNLPGVVVFELKRKEQQ